MGIVQAAATALQIVCYALRAQEPIRTVCIDVRITSLINYPIVPAGHAYIAVKLESFPLNLATQYISSVFFSQSLAAINKTCACPCYNRVWHVVRWIKVISNGRSGG